MSGKNPEDHPWHAAWQKACHAWDDWTEEDIAHELRPDPFGLRGAETVTCPQCERVVGRVYAIGDSLMCESCLDDLIPF